MRLHFLGVLAFPLLSFASQEEQIPMFDQQSAVEEAPLIHSQPSLADLLTIEPSASIFYSYARELELSAKFADSSSKLTLFVPTNKAVMALARKPHQGPPTSPDDEITISQEEYDSRSKKNVETWVSAHIVPEHPIALDTQVHPTLLEGKSIAFTPISKRDGKGLQWSQVTLEEGVRIIGMKEVRQFMLFTAPRYLTYTHPR
ncbi:hypothetical protein H0H87_007243 [Tephrocybe sp. NHM501043]|nr:hypothetical protein H0H87_007243 [Tephrocybe sp. NHM501043]